MEPQVLTLPWPPSVNTYWRNYNGRSIISEKGRIYRRLAVQCVLWQNYGRVEDGSRLSVNIEACPPDKRRRDLDNLLKAPLDALQCAGVYADDEQIDIIHIIRGPRVVGGALRVRVVAL